MKVCPMCEGDGYVYPVPVRWPPHDCPTCHGDGWVRDPLVPRDRGAPSYRPLRS